MSQVSVHQSAASNCARGEYHHVMHCMQAEDQLIVIVTCCPAIKFGLPPYLHTMH